MPITFRFNGTNEAAVAAAEKAAGDMITNISEQTRSGIRAVIVKAIRDGVPPYDAAREIEMLIGLNEKQATSAADYWQSVVENGLSTDNADSALADYVEKKVSERADTIMRTEVMSALNEGAAESWDQAQEDGLLTAAAVKEWIAADDDATCPICEDLDGVTIPVDDDFDADGEAVDMPPAHTNCRCSAAVTEP